VGIAPAVPVTIPIPRRLWIQRGIIVRTVAPFTDITLRLVTERDGRVGQAIAVAVAVVVPGRDIHVVVCDAVTVVVDLIADLDRARRPRSVGVVAVAVTDPYSVPVSVFLAGHHASAGVVQSVAELRRARVDRRIIVIAVICRFGQALFDRTPLDHLRPTVPVAVAVDVVRDSGTDSGVIVITIGRSGDPIPV